MPVSFRAGDVLAVLQERKGILGGAALAIACAILLFTSPTNGDFWWFEAPSHAMNGVFIMDLVAAMPWQDPKGYAIDYYMQYPAVTVLFYPPLFPAIEAVFFSLFGVSHFVAQLTVTAFLFAFALGMRALARFWLPELAATGVGLAALGLPVVAFWGRQVMLEMPAYAVLVWATYFLVAYMRDRRAFQIILAAVGLVGALYIKQTIAFAVPAFALALVLHQGWRVLLRAEIWIAAAIAAVLLVPLLLLTLYFGSTNAELASNVAGGPTGFWSGLFYYLLLLPSQAGWAVVAAALAFVVYEIADPRWGRRDPLLVTVTVLFVAGYVFFTAIALKDERYTIHIIGILALFAVAVLYRLVPTRFAGPLCFVFGAGVFAYGVIIVPVPRLDGHRAAAEYVAASAPERSTVLFHGQRSASFIFNLRAMGGRPDLHVLRAEKLLVHYRQGRMPGREDDVWPLEVSRTEIESYLPRYRIGYAVFESGFWVDLPTIATLESVLSQPPLTEVRKIAVDANVPHNDLELRIYRNDGPLAATRERYSLDMPLIGGRFDPAEKQGD